MSKSSQEAIDFVNSVKKNDQFPKNYIPLMMKTRNSVLVAWEDSFRGQVNFNVREFYLDNGDMLQFGKNGISVPFAKKFELLQAFTDLNVAPENYVKPDGTIDMSGVTPAST